MTAARARSGGGLEHELHAPAPVRVCGEQLGGAEADGHVGVVAAGVHDGGLPGSETLCHRRVRRVLGLGHLGGVHVEAQRHRGAVAAFKDAHRARDLDVPGQLSRLGAALPHHRFFRPPAHRVGMDAGGTRVHPVAQLAQPVHHHAGGAKLGPTRFGVAVQAAPDVGQVREFRLGLACELSQVFIESLCHNLPISWNLNQSIRPARSPPRACAAAGCPRA